MTMIEIFRLVGIGGIYGIGLGAFVLMLGYAVGGILSIFKQANK